MLLRLAVGFVLLLCFCGGEKSRRERINGTASALESLKNITWERYMNLISTPQVPEKLRKYGPRGKTFDVKNCGNGARDFVRYQKLQLSPDPLHFPGKIVVSSNIEVVEDILSPINVQIDMKKKILMDQLMLPLPCIQNYGSCSYENICSTATDCPLFYEVLGLPCGCPIKQGNYTVIDKEYRVTNFLPDFLTSGDYQVTIRAQRKSNALFCVQFTLAVQSHDDENDEDGDDVDYSTASR